MHSLAQSHCQACQPGATALPASKRADLLEQLPDWRLVERDGVMQLERLFRCADFRQALAFANAVGAAAEAENHHPALRIEWGRVCVTWWTHDVRGLHHNDFIMAARTDALAATCEGIKQGLARPSGL